MHRAAISGFLKLLRWPSYIIANDGTVSLNAPCGLVTSHLKSSAGVSSTTISKLVFLLECLHVTTHMTFYSRIKIDGLNFSEFMVIRQIHQCFPLPKFPSIRNRLTNTSTGKLVLTKLCISIRKTSYIVH